MTRFSVIVPIYNVEAYLPQCLDSIRAQTFEDFEVLCVVDGSRDRSESIARLFALADDRIRVLCKENGGLSSARNAGIEAAEGDYLFFVDSDDMLDKNALAVVDAALRGHDAEVVTFGAETWPASYPNKWLQEVLSPEEAWYASFDPKLLLQENSHPYVWRTVVKRSLLESSGLRFDETLAFGEDQVFHFQLYPRARGTLLIPDKLYRYRVLREGSLMATRIADPARRVGEHVKISARIVEDWKRQGILEKYEKEIAGFIVEFLQDDAVYYGEEDAGLLQQYRALLDAVNADARCVKKGNHPNVGEMVEYLRADGFDASSTEYAERREKFIQERCLGEPDGAQRPKWQDRLRLVLPMSALALEERLDVVRKQTDADYIRWCAEDAAACARSLELLQVELIAKGIKTS